MRHNVRAEFLFHDELVEERAHLSCHEEVRSVLAVGEKAHRLLRQTSCLGGDVRVCDAFPECVMGSGVSDWG
jgi:hypothetical protein